MAERDILTKLDILFHWEVATLVDRLRGVSSTPREISMVWATQFSGRLRGSSRLVVPYMPCTTQRLERLRGVS